MRRARLISKGTSTPRRSLARGKNFLKSRPRHPRARVRRANAIPKITFFVPEKPPIFQTIFSSASASLGEQITLPQGYGDHKIVLQVRDPWGLHAYWELSQELIRRKEEQLKQRGLSIQKWILKVYQEPPQPARVREDIHLNEIADNWYFTVEHDHAYYVEIGIVASDQSFHLLARSNKVRTPRFGMSSVIDEEWKCLGEEYWKLFALSGGFGAGSSMMERKEFHVHSKGSP